MVIEFFKSNNNRNNSLAVSDIDRAIRNAHRAICGVAERETTVRAENLPKIIKGLQGRGYTVIGTSHDKPGTKFKKVWFVQQGLGSL